MNYDEAALQRVREDRLLLAALDEWLYEEMEPHLGQRILEIGCGLGNFARHLTDRALYVGLEIDDDSICRFRADFAGYANVRALALDIGTPAYAGLADYDFDTVFSLNVFEHIKDDARALRHAAAVLRPGGRLLLVVPAHGWLYGALDRSIGHHRRYDKVMAARLFEQASIAPVQMKYMNPLGALGWFVNGRLRAQATPPSGQLRLFDRLVPALKKIEKRVPMPFGISLLAVGRKAG